MFVHKNRESAGFSERLYGPAPSQPPASGFLFPFPFLFFNDKVTKSPLDVYDILLIHNLYIHTCYIYYTY